MQLDYISSFIKAYLFLYQYISVNLPIPNCIASYILYLPICLVTYNL